MMGIELACLNVDIGPRMVGSTQVTPLSFKFFAKLITTSMSNGRRLITLFAFLYSKGSIYTLAPRTNTEFSVEYP